MSNRHSFSARETSLSKRDQWLRTRLNGIGASEAAAVLGKGRMSNLDLWKIKTGRMVQKDISDDPRVRYGIDAEAPLRDLFILGYPEYLVSYIEYDVVNNPQYPFIFATLDGRLIEKATGRKGILEIKTADLTGENKSAGDFQKLLGEWHKRIPEPYYIQVLHQFIATGFDFAILHAQFRYVHDSDIRYKTRNYRIERANPQVTADMECLKQAEIEFWQKNVAGGMMPGDLPDTL